MSRPSAILNRVRRHGLSVILVLAGIAVVLFAFRLTEQTSRTAQLCNVAHGLSHIESEFIRTDAIDRAGGLTSAEREQAIQAFDKVISPTVIKRLSDKQQALDQRTISYWRSTLLPDAKALAHGIGCP